MHKVLYILLMRMHPRRFRERFGAEMLEIFEQAAPVHGSGRLITDLFTSLLRQRFLRTNSPSQPAPISAAPLLFAPMESYRPRLSVLIHGVAFAALGFCFISYLLNHPSRLRAIIGSQRPGSPSVGVNRSSLAATDPMTQVQVSGPTKDPWRDFAEHYFKMIYVLDALDADHNLVISSREIETAPTILRSLDLDGNGILSADEVGMCLGPGNPNAACHGDMADIHGQTNFSPDFVDRQRQIFMRLNPVLAALDRNQDGEISATEIRSAAASLRSLDLNRDGSLSPIEVAPDSAVCKILRAPCVH